MAVAKKILNEKKVLAYHSLQASSASQEKYYAPSLAKDYINARCSEEEYNYDLCDRLSRSIVHVIDAQRSCLSALKQEAILSGFSNR